MPYLVHPDTIQNGTCSTVAGTTPVAAAALATIPAITTAGIAIGRHGNVKVEAQRCLTYLFIFVFFLLLSAFLLQLHLWSVGHDAPDLPPAPAAVLAGHERAQLVSRVTATGP